jgi:oligopeptide transport system substrate-binding protein
VRRKKLLLLVVGLLGSLTLAAAGCGGGNETSGTGTSGGPAGEAANQVLRMAWGAEPPSLDPGLATDTTSSNVLLAIMDPLVKLNPDTLEAEPSLAESWDLSDGGKTVTFHLRSDGKWTNGDPVTASDFVYSWKRTLSPELAADYAYQLYGIQGAAEYNSCEKKCDALADKVGVEAPDDTTLVVHLTSAQPWFIQQASHHSFLAVHQATVEKFGDKWTEPQNIVRRPVQAREVGARGGDRPRQERPVAGCKGRQADVHPGQDHRRRHHQGAGVRVG